MSKLVDLTGERIGRWTVLRRAENSKNNEVMWLCRCDCGTIRAVSRSNLRRGGSLCCGCKTNVIDLTGRKFGRWTVLSRAENNNLGQSRWLCRCSCGTEKVVLSGSLCNGSSKSCGCIKKERFETHGKSNTRLFRILQGMKRRCYYKQDLHYKDYGGRGITVCDEWKDNFQAFYDWAMANGYADDLTIERIDNNGKYEPSNCRWITIQEQQFNKRDNHYIAYKGKTQTIAEWSIELKIPKTRIYNFMKRCNWDLEKVLQEMVNTEKVI